MRGKSSKVHWLHMHAGSYCNLDKCGRFGQTGDDSPTPLQQQRSIPSPGNEDWW